MDGLMRFPKRGGGAVAPRLGGPPNPRFAGLPVTTSGPGPGTGYPWVDGDILYAADLNAAIGGGGAVGAINPITGTYGMQSFPSTAVGSDPYVSPDSYALTGSMTFRGMPFGYYDTGTLLSLVTTTAPIGASRAGVDSGFEGGLPLIAANPAFDMVNLYVGLPTSEPPLVLHSVTYDATHVYPNSPLTAAQMQTLRRNMWVLTNSIDTTVSTTPAQPNGLKPENHYGSYVTGWATDGTSITVVGWAALGSGHTAAGQVPPVGTLDPGAANATAYFGCATNVFGSNFVLQHHRDGTPNSRFRIYQGIEFDFQNFDTANYDILMTGITMTYNAVAGAHLTSDSYGMLIGGFPTCLILGQYGDYTDILLKSDAFNIIKSNSPLNWAGTPTTNLTWETQNFIDDNLMRLLCWTSRDSSVNGWQSASVHLGLHVDGTQHTLVGGSPMAQIVWNPQLFQGGVQLQNGTGVAGLTVDSNAWVYPHVANYTNDAAAGAAGIPIGAMYRNGGVLQVRLV